MYTDAQLTAAADTLNSNAKIRILAYCRQSTSYRTAPLRYPDLQGKIDAAENDATQAKPLNALLGILNSIEGQGIEKTVGIKGGSRAVDYQRSRDRLAVQEYMLHVLYDPPAGIGDPNGTGVEFLGLMPESTAVDFDY